MFLSNKFKYLVGFCLVLVLSACANTPSAEYSSIVELPQFETFQWQFLRTPDSGESLGEVYYTPIFAKNLESELGSILQDRGYIKSNKPDMYLTYYMVPAKARLTPWTTQIGPNSVRHRSINNYIPANTRPYEYTEGIVRGASTSLKRQKNIIMIIVDVFDAKTQELVWRGSTPIKDQARPRNQEDMFNMAEKILVDFPSI